MVAETVERVQAYAEKYFKARQCTEFPTVRQVARALRITQAEVLEACEGDPDALLMLTGYNFVSEGDPGYPGDLYVETVEPPDIGIKETAEEKEERTLASLKAEVILLKARLALKENRERRRCRGCAALVVDVLNQSLRDKTHHIDRQRIKYAITMVETVIRLMDQPPKGE